MKIKEIVIEDVFHGSPHRFDPDPENPYGKFSVDRIGTGEGNQAYGYGLYFASSKEVALWYKEKLSDAHWNYGNRKIRTVRSLNDYVAHFMRSGDNSNEPSAGFILNFIRNTRKVTNSHKNAALRFIDATIDKIETRKEWYTVSGALRDKFIAQDDQLISHYKIFRDFVAKEIDPKKFKWTGGYLYHVDIPEDNEYLRWEVKLMNNPQHIQDLLANNEHLLRYVEELENKRKEMNARYPERLSHPVIGKIANTEKTVHDLHGKDIYETLSKNLGGDKKASDYLRSIGIMGIKYMGDKSYNYVVFDDSRINIKKVEENEIE